MSKPFSRSLATAAALVVSATLLAPTTAQAAPGASASAATATATATATGAARARVAATADVNTGPSKWRGGKLRHPNGRRFYPEVKRWANLVLAVMAEHRIKRKWLRGILAQIQQESGGNPYAVNRWDSNARAGHPSKGLLQVIAPTYRAYAKPGYRKLRYQTVPYTNIWAALNYVIDTYGKRKFKLWTKGHNQGY